MGELGQLGQLAVVGTFVSLEEELGRTMGSIVVEAGTS